jgi:hypothetical protein
MSKNKEKRIMLGDTPNRILEEYCELTGLQQSAVITVLLLEDLWKRLARVRHSLQNEYNNTYSPTSNDPPKNTAKQKPKPRKKNKTPLPEDFDPPKAICEEAGVDHEKAVRFFKAQVEAHDYRYVDWDKAFALAVNGYLVQNYPQILQTKQENEF